MHGQSVIFKPHESGEKSFAVAPHHKQHALIQRPGLSFLIDISMALTLDCNSIGLGEFRAPPGTVWTQTEFLVRDTYNLDSARGVWRVKLHFDDDGKSSPQPSRLLQRVSIVHERNDHLEYISRMERIAIAHQRHALVPLLAAQITADATTRPARESTAMGHFVGSNALNLYAAEDIVANHYAAPRTHDEDDNDEVAEVYDDDDDDDDDDEEEQILVNGHAVFDTARSQSWPSAHVGRMSPMVTARVSKRPRVTPQAAPTVVEHV